MYATAPFIMYQAAYLLLGTPLNAYIEHYGFSCAIFTGSVLKTIGAIMKACINVNFAIMVAGQTFNAMCYVLTSSSITLFASSAWFADEERVLVLSIMDAFLSIGYIIGYFGPTLVVF